MNRGRSAIRVASTLILALNLLMSFGAIAIFMEMAPAIDNIYHRNEVSLFAGERMLTLLLREPEQAEKTRTEFAEILKQADVNITEPGEREAIARIRAGFNDVFDGKPGAREKTVHAIAVLTEINRSAMLKASQTARDLGSAGSWGIVFMSAAIFIIGLLFRHTLTVSLLDPVRELSDVLEAWRNGDRFRRCGGLHASPEFRALYRYVNALLDEASRGKDGSVPWRK